MEVERFKHRQARAEQWAHQELLMAGRRRLGARARRGGGSFYSWAQGGGGACAPRKPSCGAGRGMAGVRRKGAATCGGRRPMAALGWRGVASTHAPRGSAKDPRMSCTGPRITAHGPLGAGRPRCACTAGTAARRHGRARAARRRHARGALWLWHNFKVALFDQAFLEFLLQKWCNVWIPKL
jgi:hypothetical protein